MDTLPCALAGRCGGCSDPARPLDVQRADKAARLGALLSTAGVAFTPEAQDQAVGQPGSASSAVVTPAALAFRAHLDLRLADGLVGLIGSETPSATSDPNRSRAVIDTERAKREVIDMPRCEVASPPLNAWLAALRQDLPPIPRASLRLRVGPDGTRGLAIDCAHEDVKALLDEGAWLARHLAAGVKLEIGPKSRRVIPIAPASEAGPDPVRRVALGDPELAVWSTTFTNGRALPLYTTIAGFSQPGPIPNAALVGAVAERVRATSPKRVLELGAGAGNLTLPLLAAGLAVRAVELDGAALSRSARESQLDARLEIVAASFHRASDVAPLVMGIDTLLADPPRQGLGPFVDGLGGLSKSLRPRALVYVSCHPEALAKDAACLTALGYRLTALAGIDQFPWTHHVEWVASFER